VLAIDSDEELIEQSLDSPTTLNSTQTDLTIKELITSST
jgi:hypothetical protein